MNRGNGPRQVAVVTGAAPLVDARWPDVEAAQRRILVIPVGSLEQHGPHLPLDTDARIAVAVAERLHRLRPDVGLAPAVAYGASGEHADFPGTLSIGTDTLSNLVVELVRHASRHWDSVLVVNGHGGNGDALRRAEQICARERRRLQVEHLRLPDGDAHAGRTETSLLLHLHPEAVRLDLAEPGNTEPLARLLPCLRSEGVRAVSPNGILGDPSGASAAEGARMFDRLTASLRARLSDATT
jgi:mycofactocin system creatininase family protein